jgi:hypothetical protein
MKLLAAAETRQVRKCDAESGQSAKSRDFPGFSDASDDMAAADGRTPQPDKPAHRGSSRRIMVYWILARAGLRLTPGEAVFHAALPGLRAGENTTCQTRC